MKTILEVVVGSTVHGTSANDGLADLDLMSVIIEDMKTSIVGFSAVDTWTKRTKPEGVRSEAGDTDWVGYGLRKYVDLALRNNPTILLALFVPKIHARILTYEGAELQALAPDIVSKRSYRTFRGYMQQQHERLLGLRGQRNVTRPELVKAYGYDTKYAAHTVRLGLQGEELLLTGRISLPMRPDDRELCLDIRSGMYSLTKVSQKIVEAESRLHAAYMVSPLPEQPNVAKIERWMLDTYLTYWWENDNF